MIRGITVNQGRRIASLSATKRTKRHSAWASNGNIWPTDGGRLNLPKLTINSEQLNATINHTSGTTTALTSSRYYNNTSDANFALRDPSRGVKNRKYRTTSSISKHWYDYRKPVTTLAQFECFTVLIPTILVRYCNCYLENIHQHRKTANDPMLFFFV